MVEFHSPPQTYFSSKSHVRVVAAIPCFNTEVTITEVVTKTLGYVNEVIVIDDGSTDETSDAARRARAVVIRHETNLGKGAAMKTALSQIEADILVFIDGDGQHDPADIPKLLEPILLGEADFVIGSRYLSGSERSSNPFLRKAANAAASFVISVVISFIQPIARFISRQPLRSKANKQHLILGHSTEPQRSTDKTDLPKAYRLRNGRIKWISDCTSGFTAMKKDNCNQLHLISSGFQIETEMIFEQSKNGFIIAEVPVSCKWGESVSRLFVIRDAFKTLYLLTYKIFNFSKIQ